MDLRRLQLLETLQQFAARTDIVDQNGPRSDQGRHWLSQAAAILSRIGSRHAAAFERLASTLSMPLSGATLGPAWDQAQRLLPQAVTELAMEISSPPRERPADILDCIELIVADVQDVAHYLRAQGGQSAVARDLLSGLCNELQVTYSANRSRLTREADATVNAVRAHLWTIERRYAVAAIPGLGQQAGEELIAAHHEQDELYELQRRMVDEFRAMREAEAARRVHPTTVNITAQNIGAVQTGVQAEANVTQGSGRKRARSAARAGQG